MVATGRTGSGKTTLGNRLLGIDYFLSHGGQDCTREVNHIRFPGQLLYSDLPGVCSDDLLENFNRTSLGMPQVNDFPAVSVLTVATYSGDRPPDRRDHPANQFASAHPPPDLLLYVVAADKQFTSADRRYLTDLLTHHRQVLYVLNVFATSTPTRANIRDIVSKITAVHKAAFDVPPPMVVIDCRSGDGLPDLLDAARTLLDADHGQLLTDLIADQERDTPVAFTADVCRYLTRVASSASALAAGPSGSELPIHRLVFSLWQAVDGLRNWVTSGDARGVAPYRPLLVEAVGAAGPAAADAAEGLLDLVRELAADVPESIARQRDAIRSQIVAALAEWQAEVVRSEEQVTAADRAMAAVASDLPAARAELDNADEEFARRKTQLEASSRDIQMRSATLDHERRRFEQEVESLQDQFDEFNSTVRRLNEAGGLDPHAVREVDRFGTGLEREQDRLNRRVDAHNRANERFVRDIRQHETDVDSFNEDLGNHRQKVAEFNARVDTVRDRRAAWHRAVQAHIRQAATLRWAKERCLGGFYSAEAELSARLEEFQARLRSTLRRAAAMPEGNSPPDQFIQLEAGLRAAAADLVARAHSLRALHARLRLDRACARVLTRHTVDHFDDQGDGKHRGSTFTPLGADAVALVFATVHASATGDDGITALDALVEQYRAAIGKLSTVAPDALMAHLTSSPDLIRPEFELAITGLVFASDKTGAK
jgi:predicted  nucleic acid-binding Zn-ribbon protein